AATSPLTVLRRHVAQLRSSAATLAAAVLAARFRHSEATRAAAVLVAAKPALLTATSKAIPKLLTFMLKGIVGSATTPAATMLITISIGLLNTDISAAKLAATTFIASKVEAATASGSAAFTGASRLTTTTTPTIGCGTAMTSYCTTIPITQA